SGAEHSFVMNDHAFAATAPGQNRSLFERLVGVGDHQPLVEHHCLAQPMTNRASARWGVKGKMLGRERFVAFAGGGAEIPIGVEGFEPGRSGCRGTGGVFGWLMQSEQHALT